MAVAQEPLTQTNTLRQGDPPYETPHYQSTKEGNDKASYANTSSSEHYARETRRRESTNGKAQGRLTAKAKDDSKTSSSSQAHRDAATRAASRHGTITAHSTTSAYCSFDQRPAKPDSTRVARPTTNRARRASDPKQTTHHHDST
jgi:hypothetical protein